MTADTSSVVTQDAPDGPRDFQHTTDMGNARRLALRAKGRLLHVHGLGWLAWDGGRRARALSGQDVQAAKRMVRSIHKEAATVQQEASRAPNGDASKGWP